MIVNSVPNSIDNSFGNFTSERTQNVTIAKMDENVALVKELMRSIAVSRTNIQKALQKPEGDDNWLVNSLTKFGLLGEFSKSTEEIEAEKICKILEDAGGNFARMFDLQDELALFFNQKDANVEFVADHFDTPIGPRLTERGRAQVLSGKYRLPVVSWCDPDFEEPIRSDEIAFVVPTLLRLSLVTDDSPILTKTLDLPGFLGHIAKFALCHYNPIAAEWTTPRVKLRMIASYSVSFWLMVTILLTILTGSCMSVLKYYTIFAITLFVANFILFRYRL